MGSYEFDLNMEEKRDCLKEPFPFPITIMKGYKNAGLLRDFSEGLLAHPVALELYNWLQDTLVPDEHLIPTLVTLNATKLESGNRNNSQAMPGVIIILFVSLFLDDDGLKAGAEEDDDDAYDEPLSVESLNNVLNAQLHLPKGDLKALGDMTVPSLPRIETLYACLLYTSPSPRDS